MTGFWGSLVQRTSMGSSDQARHCDSCTFVDTIADGGLVRAAVLGAGVDRVHARSHRNGRAGEDAKGVVPAGRGRHRHRKVAPVQHVPADGVIPAHIAPGGRERVVLEKHVIPSVEIDGPVRVVHPILRGQQMKLRTLGIDGEPGRRHRFLGTHWPGYGNHGSRGSRGLQKSSPGRRWYRSRSHACSFTSRFDEWKGRRQVLPPLRP